MTYPQEADFVICLPLYYSRAEGAGCAGWTTELCLLMRRRPDGYPLRQPACYVPDFLVVGREIGLGFECPLFVERLEVLKEVTRKERSAFASQNGNDGRPGIVRCVGHELRLRRKCLLVKDYNDSRCWKITCSTTEEASLSRYAQNHSAMTLK